MRCQHAATLHCIFLPLVLLLLQAPSYHHPIFLKRFAQNSAMEWKRSSSVRFFVDAKQEWREWNRMPDNLKNLSQYMTVIALQSTVYMIGGSNRTLEEQHPYYYDYPPDEDEDAIMDHQEDEKGDREKQSSTLPPSLSSRRKKITIARRRKQQTDDAVSSVTAALSPPRFGILSFYRVASTKQTAWSSEGLPPLPVPLYGFNLAHTTSLRLVESELPLDYFTAAAAGSNVGPDVTPQSNMSLPVIILLPFAGGVQSHHHQAEQQRYVLRNEEKKNEQQKFEKAKEEEILLLLHFEKLRNLTLTAFVYFDQTIPLSLTPSCVSEGQWWKVSQLPLEQLLSSSSAGGGSNGRKNWMLRSASSVVFQMATASSTAPTDREDNKPHFLIVLGGLFVTCCDEVKTTSSTTTTFFQERIIEANVEYMFVYRFPSRYQCHPTEEDVNQGSWRVVSMGSLTGGDKEDGRNKAVSVMTALTHSDEPLVTLLNAKQIEVEEQTTGRKKNIGNKISVDGGNQTGWCDYSAVFFDGNEILPPAADAGTSPPFFLDKAGLLQPHYFAAHHGKEEKMKDAHQKQLVGKIVFWGGQPCLYNATQRSEDEETMKLYALDWVVTESFLFSFPNERMDEGEEKSSNLKQEEEERIKSGASLLHRVAAVEEITISNLTVFSLRYFYSSRGTPNELEEENENKQEIEKLNCRKSSSYGGSQQRTKKGRTRTVVENKNDDGAMDQKGEGELGASVEMPFFSTAVFPVRKLGNYLTAFAPYMYPHRTETKSFFPKPFYPDAAPFVLVIDLFAGFLRNHTSSSSSSHHSSEMNNINEEKEKMNKFLEVQVYGTNVGIIANYPPADLQGCSMAVVGTVISLAGGLTVMGATDAIPGAAPQSLLEVASIHVFDSVGGLSFLQNLPNNHEKQSRETEFKVITVDHVTSNENISLMITHCHSGDAIKLSSTTLCNDNIYQYSSSSRNEGKGEESLYVQELEHCGAKPIFLRFPVPHVAVKSVFVCLSRGGRPRPPSTRHRCTYGYDEEGHYRVSDCLWGSCISSPFPLSQQLNETLLGPLCYSYTPSSQSATIPFNWLSLDMEPFRVDRLPFTKHRHAKNTLFIIFIIVIICGGVLLLVLGTSILVVYKWKHQQEEGLQQKGLLDGQKSGGGDAVETSPLLGSDPHRMLLSPVRQLQRLNFQFRPFKGFMAQHERLQWYDLGEIVGRGGFGTIFLLSPSAEVKRTALSFLSEATIAPTSGGTSSAIKRGNMSSKTNRVKSAASSLQRVIPGLSPSISALVLSQLPLCIKVMSSQTNVEWSNLLGEVYLTILLSRYFHQQIYHQHHANPLIIPPPAALLTAESWGSGQKQQTVLPSSCRVISSMDNREGEGEGKTAASWNRVAQSPIVLVLDAQHSEVLEGPEEEEGKNGKTTKPTSSEDGGLFPDTHFTPLQFGSLLMEYCGLGDLATFIEEYVDVTPMPFDPSTRRRPTNASGKYRMLPECVVLSVGKQLSALLHDFHQLDVVQKPTAMTSSSASQPNRRPTSSTSTSSTPSSAPSRTAAATLEFLQGENFKWPAFLVHRDLKCENILLRSLSFGMGKESGNNTNENNVVSGPSLPPSGVPSATSTFPNSERPSFVDPEISEEMQVSPITSFRSTSTTTTITKRNKGEKDLPEKRKNPAVVEQKIIEKMKKSQKEQQKQQQRRNLQHGEFSEDSEDEDEEEDEDEDPEFTDEQIQQLVSIEIALNDFGQSVLYDTKTLHPQSILPFIHAHDSIFEYPIDNDVQYLIRPTDQRSEPTPAFSVHYVPPEFITDLQKSAASGAVVTTTSVLYTGHSNTVRSRRSLCPSLLSSMNPVTATPSTNGDTAAAGDKNIMATSPQQGLSPQQPVGNSNVVRSPQGSSSMNLQSHEDSSSGIFIASNTNNPSAGSYSLSLEEKRKRLQSADTWGIGAVLYMMCSGRVYREVARVLFTDINEPNFYSDLEKELHQLRGYSTPLVQCIAACLKQDPLQRPTCDEVNKRFEEIFAE